MGNWEMRKSVFVSASLAVLSVASAVAYGWAAPAQTPVPELGGRELGWIVNFWDFQLDPPPGSGHGPMKTDPAYPYVSQIQNGGQVRATKGEYQIAIVDTKDPILKPWAAKQMQETNDELLNGTRKLPYRAQSRCFPGGIPDQLLFLEPLYFIQTKEKVVMLWQRNTFARHIRLGGSHPANVTPSWFGDSVGHYENGDTLVIDTVGLSTKNSYIDSFRTPHSEKLHVVERFTIAPDKKSITGIITVEDPDTFNGPLTLKQVWRRSETEIVESVCAADGGVEYFDLNLHPIPEADTPDF
jgi:hypothetical protein